MEPNLNLYITVLTITFSYLTVRGAKLIYILNKTIYTPHTPQVHTLTQAHTGYIFPQVLLLLAISWREQGLGVCAPRGSQSWSMPSGWGTLQPTSLALGRQPVAAKCSFFLEVQATWILCHWENIQTWSTKWLCFFDPSVRTRIRILERDIVYQKNHFPL